MSTEHHAVLALGSNLGDREATIRAGIRDIAAVPGLHLVAASTLIETPALKPEGSDADAPDYLNAVVTARTTLDPHDLLRAMHAIERDHGRVRDVRWGDRTLDIDVIEFGCLMIASGDLTVPHPRAGERAFVLARGRSSSRMPRCPAAGASTPCSPRRGRPRASIPRSPCCE